MIRHSYSLEVIKVNKQASARLAGVKLGRVCIKHNIPVQTVANTLSVSRQTIYNWFQGVRNPGEENLKKVIAFLQKYK